METHSLPSRQTGMSLAEFVIASHGKLQQNAVALLEPLLSYLGDLHAADSCHGDLRPEKIQIKADGDSIDLAFLQSLEDGSSGSEAVSQDGEVNDRLRQGQREDLINFGKTGYFLVRVQEPPPPAIRKDKEHLFSNEERRTWPGSLLEAVETLLHLEVEPQQKTPTPEEIRQLLLHVVEKPFVQSETNPGTPPEPTLDSPRPATALASPAQPPPSLKIPNASAGKEYRCDVAELLRQGAPGLAEIGSITTEEALPPGIRWEEGTILAGVPEKAESYRSIIHCHSPNPPPGRPASLPRLLQWTINPDPKSLWKNLPSNQDAPFWKEDKAAAAVEPCPHLLLAASTRGRSHAHEGLGRDDDFQLCWFPSSDWSAIVVADGAGSAKYSRRGAQLACQVVRVRLEKELGQPEETLTEKVQQWLDEPAEPATEQNLNLDLYHLLGGAALAARKSIEVEAGAHKATARDFHTTLILVILKPFADGWFLASIAIGDGAAGVAGLESGEAPMVMKPDSGEFAGQTLFLTMKEALATGESVVKRLHHAFLPKLTAVMVMTDGVSDPKFASHAELLEADCWNRLWDEVWGVLREAPAKAEAAGRLLAWLDFWSPGNHDDRTIAVFQPQLPPAS